MLLAQLCASTEFELQNIRVSPICDNWNHTYFFSRKILTPLLKLNYRRDSDLGRITVVATSHGNHLIDQTHNRDHKHLHVQCMYSVCHRQN